ncbi:MAG TPA: TRAP transporter large permease subunit [Alphaproteobacteria bacterium]|nr:TRAP transporter large permease subunit [Alphaproteobacteria bacterium]
MSDPILGLTMLGLIVAAIMMGFPTAFTLMGMGMLFGFAAFYDPAAHWYNNQIFDLMVQRTYGAMMNDTLISIPLFVFMGYLIERAALVDKMFRSVQLAFRRVPASLAVTTLMVCAFWGMASGIVGAVVVLMGVIALRPMLNAGYDVRLASGAITAGGTLGILIPPSVMLIVYAAVAGQSIVKLYAAAMLPGFFLAFMYILYIVGTALINPKLAPKLPEDMYHTPVPDWLKGLERGPQKRIVGGLLAALFRPGMAKGMTLEGKPVNHWIVVANVLQALVPLLLTIAIFALAWWFVLVRNAPDAGQAPQTVIEFSDIQGADRVGDADDEEQAEPLGESEGLQEPGQQESTLEESPGLVAADEPERTGAPEGFYAWYAGLAVAVALILGFYYWRMDGEQLEILKMVEASVLPLAVLTLSVLGSILFGITTATESAGIGSIGAMFLAAMQKYRRLTLWGGLVGMIIGASLGSMRGDTMTIIISGVLGGLFIGAATAWVRDLTSARQLFGTMRESVFLTAKTTAMVCWLFVGSALFSAVFALHGGQQIIERWVLGLDLTPLQFMIMAQLIIFLLGWPLEWTEIIVIFVPIFIPLLTHFNVDPVLFGTMVAVNLQAAFLSPPVAMSAFYLKGVAPSHVTINQIFAGMMPYMLIVILLLVIMYLWPGMALMLPEFLYR